MPDLPPPSATGARAAPDPLAVTRALLRHLAELARARGRRAAVPAAPAEGGTEEPDASDGEAPHWLADLPAEVFVEAEAGPGEVLFSVPLIPLRPPSVPVEFDAWLAMRHWYRSLRDLADEELALVTGLLAWRPPDGPVVRGHLLSTPVQIVMDERTERVDVVLAGPTSPRDRELLSGVPGFDPGRADWVWEAVQNGQGFALQASASDVLRKWCSVAFSPEDAAAVYRDDWAAGGAPGEIPSVRLAPALVVRRRPESTGLAAHYELLISRLADPPPDGLVRFLAADLRVLHVPEPKPNAAAELAAGMTAQGRRVLVVRSEPEPGGIPPRPDLPEVPPLTDGEAAELLRLLGERTLAPPAEPATLPDPSRIRALINVERAVPPEASGEVARRLRQFDPAVLTRLTGRVAQVDGILNEIGLGGHPSRWPSGDPAARAFADILARRRPAVWERVTEMGVQAERAHRAVRSLRGRRVVLPPEPPARDLADAAHELRAHLLTGGTLKRGPMRSGAQRKAEPLLATVTVDGHPPTTPALLEIVLTHLTAEITCQELHYVWEAAGVPFRTDLPLPDRAARFAEAHARLGRVRILTPVLTEVAELGIPLTHPLQWHGLTIGLAAAHLATEADRATAALTALRDALDPSLTTLRAALDARDPDAYARALHALAESNRIRARRETLLARLRAVHPDLAARMTADPSAYAPLAQTWTPSWKAARAATPDAVPLWDVPAAIPPTPDSLDAIILENLQDAGPEALFLLWYTPRVILLGPPGPTLPPANTPRPPLPPDLHTPLSPTTPLYNSLLTRALPPKATPRTEDTPHPETTPHTEPDPRRERALRSDPTRHSEASHPGEPAQPSNPSAHDVPAPDESARPGEAGPANARSRDRTGGPHHATGTTARSAANEDEPAAPDEPAVRRGPGPSNARDGGRTGSAQHASGIAARSEQTQHSEAVRPGEPAQPGEVGAHDVPAHAAAPDESARRGEAGPANARGGGRMGGAQHVSGIAARGAGGAVGEDESGTRDESGVRGGAGAADVRGGGRMSGVQHATGHAARGASGAAEEGEPGARGDVGARGETGARGGEAAAFGDGASHAGGVPGAAGTTHAEENAPGAGPGAFASGEFPARAVRPKHARPQPPGVETPEWPYGPERPVTPDAAESAQAPAQTAHPAGEPVPTRGRHAGPDAVGHAASSAQHQPPAPSASAQPPAGSHPSEHERLPTHEPVPGREGMPVREAAPAGEGVSGHEGVPARGDVPAPDGVPARENAPAGEDVPAREDVRGREGFPAREGPAARGGVPGREGEPAREATPASEGVSARERVPAHEAFPVREGMPTREPVPGRDGMPVREGVPAREGGHAREAAPGGEGVPGNEGVPARDGVPARENAPAGERVPAHEGVPAHEAFPVREGVPGRGDGPAREGVAGRQGVPAREGAPALEEVPARGGVPAGEGGLGGGGVSGGEGFPVHEGVTAREVVPAVRIEPGRSIVSYAREDLRILVERLLRASPGLSENEVVARATRLLACPADEAELVDMRIRYALHERG
ncbi:hypothetical protein [Actinomadura rupiterrae]|uniref:hypothetical protein n=1 Tax=Actinomadura rupiterrae TaxID=559627 RepID=UPI0020A3EF43|nr:hypothetical protein [Actinomadura rupiterrae]MCP2335089.1 hypothetical protein [Actinomadura rupiterrae]